MRARRIVVDYVNDMYMNAQKAMEFVEGMDFADFEVDERIQYAVIRALEIIGEAAKYIPDDVAGQYPQIPWRSIRGMRNKLIHAYFGVDTFVVWLTVQEDLPFLLQLLERMRSDLQAENE